MDGTIIQQGSFTSTGAAKFIPLESGCDWIETYNMTQIGTHPATETGYQFYWQAGMGQDRGIEWQSIANLDSTSMFDLASGGFTYVDTSSLNQGILNTNIVSIIWGATGTIVTPWNNLNVVTTGAPHGLVDGDIIRIYNITTDPIGHAITAPQLGGIDFEVMLLTPAVATTFALKYAAQLAVPSDYASYRVIPYDPIYYPRMRVITNISRGLPGVATVTTSVPHGFTVGQEVRLNVYASGGMTEINGMIATVLSIPNDSAGNPMTGRFTINIDTSGFTVFTFPVPLDLPCTAASAVPMGESLTVTHDLQDATYNTAETGVSLAAGIDSPAGVANDLIYWKAGKTFNT